METALRTVNPVRNSNRETHTASKWSRDCARKTHKASAAALSRRVPSEPAA